LTWKDNPMGWTISHAPYGETIRRSALSIGNLGRELAHVMPSRDWRTVAFLFTPKSGDPFDVAPADAGRIANALNLAAVHPLMPADWGELARQIAAAADTAAKNREPWHWS
jgi:hypothetical protein